MKPRRNGALLVAITAATALAGGVTATEPQAVTITVRDTGPADPFTASGGPICAAGNVSNISVLFVAWETGTRAQIQEVKRFVCPDGSFDLLLRITLDFATGETVATWSVLDGTSAYASLHGAGSLIGDPDRATNSILDSYSGRMHID
jgi:hypothetical protein